MDYLILLILIIISCLALLIGHHIKGSEKVFGQRIKTNRQAWARFWLTCGWVVLVLTVAYLIFDIILHLYLKLY